MGHKVPPLGRGGQTSPGGPRALPASHQEHCSPLPACHLHRTDMPPLKVVGLWVPMGDPGPCGTGTWVLDLPMHLCSSPGMGPLPALPGGFPGRTLFTQPLMRTSHGAISGRAGNSWDEQQYLTQPLRFWDSGSQVLHIEDVTCNTRSITDIQFRYAPVHQRLPCTHSKLV